MTTERRKTSGLALALAVLAGLLGWFLLRQSEEDTAHAPGEKSRKTAKADAQPARLEGRASTQPAGESQVGKAEIESAPSARTDEKEPPSAIAIEGIFQRVGTRTPVDVGRFILRWSQGEAPIRRAKPNDVELTTDREGAFVAEIEAPGVITVSGIWPKDGQWRSHAWYLEGGEGGDQVTASPDEPARIVVEVTAMIQLKGVVVDPEGQPLADVHINYSVPHANGSKTWAGYMTTTSDNGAFTIMGMLAHPEAVLDKDAAPVASLIRFQRDGFTALAVNVHDVDEADRDRWRVVLSRGLSIEGILVDDTGRTIPNIDVEAVYDDPTKRRTGKTDENGVFMIAALSEGSLTLRALVLDQDLEARKPMTLTSSATGVELLAAPIPPGEWGGPVPVMGIRLVDASEALRKKYDLPQHAAVVVVDPGANHMRLGIGTLREGYGIWKIGDEAVKGVKHTVERILSEHAKAKKVNPRFPTVRIVYVYGGKAVGSNTQHLVLSPADIASLERTATALR